jgi:formylglycine-generating enzyme required for sulfatase activity
MKAWAEEELPYAQLGDIRRKKRLMRIVTAFCLLLYSSPVTPHPMKLIIQRQIRRAKYYPEDLGNGVTWDMVLIPGGTFLMGSPEDELERSDRESPQHEVTVPSFFMGKYPVTQAQWKAVAALPKVNQDLEPNPSDFKGSDRPVENVSWHDATEFCRRLAQKTGMKTARLCLLLRMVQDPP